jgi:hypothetical protein
LGTGFSGHGGRHVVWTGVLFTVCEFREAVRLGGDKAAYVLLAYAQ